MKKDHGKWTKRFPDEFWYEIFRLKGWDWQGMNVNRPSFVGKIVNDIIYSRLAPSVLDELRELNPSISGKRKVRHHQFLTDDIGHPALQHHLYAVISMMRGFPDRKYDQFHRALVRSFPKNNDQFALDIDD